MKKIKVYDEKTRKWVDIAIGEKGEKGDKGDPGPAVDTSNFVTTTQLDAGLQEILNALQ